MRWWVWPVVLMLCATPVLAAQISGTIYTQDLEVARYSVVTMNTTPPQRAILIEGIYQLSVPPGTYHMQASLNVEGKIYEDEVNITIADNGTYSYDFILFPAESASQEHIPAVDEDLVFAETPRRKESAINWVAITILVIVLAAAVIAAILARKKSSTQKSSTGKEQGGEEEIAPDLQGTLTFIREQGGRTTQKELRKHIPCSEAKLSMMLTELEAKGKIEKIKKGRGNLIILRR